MTALFVAGAGTDVGKTYLSELLLRDARARGRRVRALKPVASGMPPLDDPAFAASDTGRLLCAAGEPLSARSVDACSPWRFRAPLSPDMAAQAEGRLLVFDEIVAWTRAAIARAQDEAASVLVEGVGGLMSPMCETATNLDFALALGCPVLLVSGSYLGAISHAATAWACGRANQLQMCGIVVSETDGSGVDLAAAAERVARFSSGARVVTLARGAQRSTPSLESLIAL